VQSLRGLRVIVAWGRVVRDETGMDLEPYQEFLAVLGSLVVVLAGVVFALV
jgi:hypothetical protein